MSVSQPEGTRAGGLRRLRFGATAPEPTPTPGSARPSLVPANRRDIPVTCYDLLNGRFHTAARNRLGFVALAVFVVLGIVANVSLATGARSELASLKTQSAKLGAERVTIINRFGSLDAVKGLSQESLLEYSAKLKSDASLALGRQTDVVAILDALAASRAAGVRIVSVDMSFKKLDAKQTTKEIDSPVLRPITVRITAAGAVFEDLVSWSQSLRELPLFADVAFTRVGEGVIIDATTVPTLVPTEALSILSLYGVGQEFADTSINDAIAAAEKALKEEQEKLRKQAAEKEGSK